MEDLNCCYCHLHFLENLGGWGGGGGGGGGGGSVIAYPQWPSLIQTAGQKYKSKQQEEWSHPILGLTATWPLMLYKGPYFNTPDPQTGLSPAMCLFSRPIKDFIPILPGRYEPHPTWIDTLNKKEDALRNRQIQATEPWTQHTKQLPAFCVGDHVRVQNQTGPHPLKWNKTGWIVEIQQFDQCCLY